LKFLENLQNFKKNHL